MLIQVKTAALSSAAIAVCNAVALAEEAGGHGGGGGGLFIGDLGNLVWTLVIFLAVLWVLGRFAWGPLLKTLNDREKYIRDSLESARKDRESAEARLKEYEQKLNQAHDERVALLDEARRDGEYVKRRIESDAKHSADEMIERAKREIGIARDSALRDLYEQSAGMAMNMAGEVLKRQLSPEDHQKLVQDMLSQMRDKPEHN